MERHAVTAAEVVRIFFRAIPPGTKLNLDPESLRKLLLAASEGSGETSAMVDLASPFPSATEVTNEGGEMTVKEASDLLGITRQAVLAAIHDGRLRGRRVGKVYLVEGSSLQSFLERRRLVHREGPNSDATP